MARHRRYRGPAATAVVLLLASFLFPAGAAQGRVLEMDTVWQGVIRLEEDLVVPRGRTLVLRAGTRVEVVPADSSKMDPEYLSPKTEITLRGHLEVEGEADRPVTFAVAAGEEGTWAGILVDGGNLWLRSARIEGAETGVFLRRGWAKLKHSELRDNAVGMVVYGEHSGAKLEQSRVTGNGDGVVTVGAGSFAVVASDISGNGGHDRLDLAGVPPVALPPLPEPVAPPLAHVYDDQTLAGTTVWRGRILVRGMVRLPADARLFITPGTVVEFSRRDSNNDGIGENGLYLQGQLVAKGSEAAPIWFRSAEAHRQPGDWDAINIMGSDAAQNILEHCVVEDAYRGLHFHFANVGMSHLVCRNNYRGIQFQESLVLLRHSMLVDNRSGIQARDSEVVFADNLVAANWVGANFLRLQLAVAGNRFLANVTDGIRLREGVVHFHDNLAQGNRVGLSVMDAVYGRYQDNRLTANWQAGLALRNVDNLEVTGNRVTGNGQDGITVQESRCTIGDNLVADNRERAMAVRRFSGRLRGNGILAVPSGLALEVAGDMDVDAAGNWWGTDDPATVIRDGDDQPGLGRVRYRPLAASPPAWLAGEGGR